MLCMLNPVALQSCAHRSIKFKVVKEIGSGSFSRVYRATHRLSGLDYALKRSRSPLCTDAERNRWLQVRECPL
jgi:serine/threonine protein kinase